MFSPSPIRRSGRAPSKAGTISGSGAHQVRRERGVDLALEQRLAHQPEVEVLQVAQAAVDELARARRGAGGEVGPLHQRDRVAARGGVERDAGAGDARRRSRARRTARRPARGVASGRGSITAGRNGTRRAARARARACPGPCARPRWIRPSTRSPSGMPQRGAALGRAQDGGRAPVAAEPAGVRAEQHDELAHAAAAKSSSSATASSSVRTTEAATASARGRAWRPPPGPAAALSASSDSRAEHAEAPRVREVVVRRPAGELEQLVERRAVDRLGLVGLVGAARCGSARRSTPG